MTILTREERKNSAQIHLQNIQANTKHRLDTARALKNEELVELLEEEDNILHLGRSNSKFGM